MAEKTTNERVKGDKSRPPARPSASSTGSQRKTSIGAVSTDAKGPSRRSASTTGRVSGSTGRQMPARRKPQKAPPKQSANPNANAHSHEVSTQKHGRVQQKAKQQVDAPAQHARDERSVNPMLVGGIIGALVLVILVILFVVSCNRPGGILGAIPSSDGESAQGSGSTGGAVKPETSVSFCAVGANIANADILSSADAWAGTIGDGNYDFSPLYEQMSSVIAPYDIAFVNQGSTLGGHGNFEYQGFPSYNTPDTMADALEGAGFDVVNVNTNHTFDMWVSAVEHSHSVWAQHPNVTTVGSYASQADRDNIRIVERSGMSIAFLSYSYGQNGYKLSDLPNDFYAPPFDKTKMRTEVERAKELADAVVVYLHFNEMDEITGSTDPTRLTDQQEDYASYLAGLGVDLVLGCRGQSIQPVRYVGRGIRTTDGSGVTPENGMLCVYGLGDFVSAYTLPSAVLSGMFSCDFVRDASGEVHVVNPTWHGLVEHRSGGVDYVCPLANYTPELAASNELLARLREIDPTATDPLQWARATTVRMVGDAVAVKVE